MAQTRTTDEQPHRTTGRPIEAHYPTPAAVAGALKDHGGHLDGHAGLARGRVDQAGAAKLWGAENPAFLHHNGAGVAGFATHGAAAYTWWGSFLHSFVVPNAAPIGVFIAVAEFAIGIALVLGFFTPLASLGSLALLFTYVMSGTASVCAFYALFAIVILATWRTSSWLGVDGFIGGYVQRRRARRLLACSAPALSVVTAPAVAA